MPSATPSFPPWLLAYYFQIEIAFIDAEWDGSTEHIDLDADLGFIDLKLEFCALTGERTILDHDDIASVEARGHLGCGDNSVVVGDGHERIHRKLDRVSVADEIDDAENRAESMPCVLSNHENIAGESGCKTIPMTTAKDAPTANFENIMGEV